MQRVVILPMAFQGNSILFTHLLASFIDAEPQLDHAVDPLGMHCRLLNR